MLDPVALLLAAIDHQKHGHIADAEAIYRSVLAADPDQPSALFLLGSLLLGTGRAEAAAALLGRAVALRPDHAEQRLALARALLVCGRAGEARDAVQHLAEIPDPRLAAEACFLCGTALNALGRPAEAVAAFERALASNPRHPQAALNLGNAWIDLDELDRAEGCICRALALDPALAEAYASLGHLLTRRGRLADAVAACGDAIAVRPDFVQAHWNQAIALLLGGRFAEGWDKYEWRRQRPGTPEPPAGPRWDGEPLRGRTLLVVAEQGYGDCIQFARYLPIIVEAGSKVLLRCARAVAPLMRQMPGITVLGDGVDPQRYDLWVDLMSLPRLFGTDLATIPLASGYLRADPGQAAAWEAMLPPRAGEGRRIGLVWSGNPEHSNDSRRSMPTAALAPLVAAAAAVPGLTLTSLQVGPRSREIAAQFGIPDLSPALTDFAETAAAVSRMDLVVAVDTAVSHLAGALGVPAIVMLPHAPDWRWLLGREDSPWYASLRLVRQERPGDWDGVVQRVASMLATGALI